MKRKAVLLMISFLAAAAAASAPSREIRAAEAGKTGVAEVGYMNEDGTLEVQNTCETPKDAWDAAQEMCEKSDEKENEKVVIRLTDSWDLKEQLTLPESKEITVDLNGYPISRNTSEPKGPKSSDYLIGRVLENAANIVKRHDPNGNKKDGGVFSISKDAELSIIDSNPESKVHKKFKGGVIEGGKNQSSGGLIQVKGSLTMTGGTLNDGGTSSGGGAIHVEGGNLKLEDTAIVNCWSENAGAVMADKKSKAEIKNCRIKNCEAYSQGGALYVSDGSLLSVSGTDITGCKALHGEGGALFEEDGGDIKMKGCHISGCAAEYSSGGAIYQVAGKLLCKDTVFEKNNAEYGDGGALYYKGMFFGNENYQTWMIGCSFKENKASRDGGAIYQDHDYLYMENCTVTGNTCENRGGGVYVNSNSFWDKAGGIDIAGIMVIKGNDGVDNMDNLVLEPGRYIYDQGLFEGSEVHVRSAKNGAVALSENTADGRISSYQASRYFVDDSGEGIHLSDTDGEREELIVFASPLGAGAAFGAFVS